MTGRRFLALCLGMALLACAQLGTAEAQDSKKTDKKTNSTITSSRWLLELEEKLNLTEDQKDTLARLKQDFLDKHKTEVKRMRDEAEKIQASIRDAEKKKDKYLTRKAQSDAKNLQDTAMKLFGEFEATFVGVLTEPQKKKYEVIRKDFSKTLKVRDVEDLPLATTADKDAKSKLTDPKNK